jgi:hypothetical protein
MTEIQIKDVIGEVVRLGDTYPDPVTHTNDDESEVKVIYLDVRANGMRYKVQIRGDRALAAFADREFFNNLDGQWYLFEPPELGDWVKVTGSYSLKPPTEKFDQHQHQLICWEPWNIRRQTIPKRPAKKNMASW